MKIIFDNYLQKDSFLKNLCPHNLYLKDLPDDHYTDECLSENSPKRCSMCFKSCGIDLEVTEHV